MIKNIFVGTVIYIAITFPLAVVWHMVLFSEIYTSIGYLDENPNILLGFLSICLQGVILSGGFAFLGGGGGIVRGLRFALFAGALYWTCHVIAYAAKNDAANTAAFYLLETPYLALQFGVFGLLIGLVFRAKNSH